MTMQSERMVRVEALPQGFAWGAVAAGIKVSGKPDLAAAVVAKRGWGAAVYTRNQVVAAPVTVGRKHLLGDGRARERGAGECGQCKLRHGAGWD